jgi:hypothetical protein
LIRSGDVELNPGPKKSKVMRSKDPSVIEERERRRRERQSDTQRRAGRARKERAIAYLRSGGEVNPGPDHPRWWGMNDLDAWAVRYEEIRGRDEKRHKTGGRVRTGRENSVAYMVSGGEWNPGPETRGSKKGKPKVAPKSKFHIMSHEKRESCRDLKPEVYGKIQTHYFGPKEKPEAKFAALDWRQYRDTCPPCYNEGKMITAIQYGYAGTEVVSCCPACHIRLTGLAMPRGGVKHPRMKEMPSDDITDDIDSCGLGSLDARFSRLEEDELDARLKRLKTDEPGPAPKEDTAPSLDAAEAPPRVGLRIDADAVADAIKAALTDGLDLLQEPPDRAPLKVTPLPPVPAPTPLPVSEQDRVAVYVPEAIPEAPGPERDENGRWVSTDVPRLETTEAYLQAVEESGFILHTDRLMDGTLVALPPPPTPPPMPSSPLWTGVGPAPPPPPLPPMGPAARDPVITAVIPKKKVEPSQMDKLNPLRGHVLEVKEIKAVMDEVLKNASPIETEFIMLYRKLDKWVSATEVEVLPHCGRVKYLRGQYERLSKKLSGPYDPTQLEDLRALSAICRELDKLARCRAPDGTSDRVVSGPEKGMPISPYAAGIPDPAPEYTSRLEVRKGGDRLVSWLGTKEVNRDFTCQVIGKAQERLDLWAATKRTAVRAGSWLVSALPAAVGYAVETAAHHYEPELFPPPVYSELQRQILDVEPWIDQHMDPAIRRETESIRVVPAMLSAVLTDMKKGDVATAEASALQYCSRLSCLPIPAEEALEDVRGTVDAVIACQKTSACFHGGQELRAPLLTVAAFRVV